MPPCTTTNTSFQLDQVLFFLSQPLRDEISSRYDSRLRTERELEVDPSLQSSSSEVFEPGAPLVEDERTFDMVTVALCCRGRTVRKCAQQRHEALVVVLVVVVVERERGNVVR